MKTNFSVNLNKVALVRNSRGEGLPDLCEMAKSLIAAGCDGITIHPREGEPHAKLSDVHALNQLDGIQNDRIELNIEGSLRQELMDVLLEENVHQFTIVPDAKGQITTTRGWEVDERNDDLAAAIALFTHKKTRISLFLEADCDAVDYAAKMGVDAVELHTKWYAIAFEKGDYQTELDQLKGAADRARELGLRVHLGHDLNLQNTEALIKLIHPEEVSIGHALTAEALYLGMPIMVEKYLACFS